MTERPADRGLLSAFAPQGRARVVHAQGCGAFGSFTVTGDIARFTRARLFAGLGKRTEVLARFSTGEGPADMPAERDVQGFSLKFYTEEGNWDLVGHDTPVFFIRDPAAFPAMVRSRSRDSATGRRSPAAMWDFFSRHPETLHQVTILFSDRGRPASPRFMSGYGGHAYSFWNDNGERFWVKFHLKTMQGYRQAGPGEGADRFGRDLAEAIGQGDFPRWRLCVQIMSEAEVARLGHDPFDLTKVWPQAEFPLIEAGVLELDRNPVDADAEVERAAFSPSNVVPGIGFSPDRMLQARIFSYAEAHRARLGAHYEALTVNAPRLGGDPYCRVQGAEARGRGLEASLVGAGADQAAARVAVAASDDYAQARVLFRRLGSEAKDRLCRTVAGALADAPGMIVERQLALFDRVDSTYAEGVSRALKRPMAAISA